MTRAAADRSNRLERGLAVLQAFRPDGRPLRLTDIIIKVGFAKSTTHRLVSDLLRLGFLERHGDDYVLGRAVFELGELVPVRLSLREVAQPHMQDLFRATRSTVHLAVRDDLDALYIDRIHDHAAPKLPSRVGGRLPLSSTGVGKVLLAFGESDIIDEVATRPLRRLTPQSVGDPTTLRRQLREARSRGFAYEREEAAAGIACVAAPVLEGGRVVAAVSVSVPIEKGEPELRRLAPAVCVTAAGISRSLIGR